MADAGSLLREARQRHGVSQKNLAMRASTTQSAISRIECNRVSPSLDTLEELLFLLGEDLVMEAQPRTPNVDVEAIRERLQLTPTERIRRGLDEASRIIIKKSAGRRDDTSAGSG
ncbi:MAG TPA: helix-turn-helix domain-containing protein [Solirubrobacterales bacterium]